MITQLKNLSPGDVFKLARTGDRYILTGIDGYRCHVIQIGFSKPVRHLNFQCYVEV